MCVTKTFFICFADILVIQTISSGLFVPILYSCAAEDEVRSVLNSYIMWQNLHFDKPFTIRIVFTVLKYILEYGVIAVNHPLSPALSGALNGFSSLSS